MAKRIAVEEGLTNVVQALQEQGFEVTKLTEGRLPDVAAAVISGMSRNFMGIADTDGNKMRVIEASGRTADEIVESVRSAVELQQ